MATKLSKSPVIKLGHYLLMSKCPAPVSAAVQSKGTSSEHKQVHFHGVKPVVLLLPWLGASQDALARYRQLYHDYGLDVITVKIGARHFLWPPLAKNITDELTGYFSNQEKSKPLLVHSFSIGSYLYSVWLSEFLEDAKKFAPIQNRIRGQVFDSIVIGGLRKMIEGVARGLSKNSVAKSTIKWSLVLYYAVTQNTTVRMYDKFIDAFKNNPIQSPILAYYCWNDPMSDGTEVEKVISLWQQRNEHSIMKKDWEKSTHAANLKEHPDDYRLKFGEFMNSVVKNINEEHVKSKL